MSSWHTCKAALPHECWNNTYLSDTSSFWWIQTSKRVTCGTFLKKYVFKDEAALQVLYKIKQWQFVDVCYKFYWYICYTMKKVDKWLSIPQWFFLFFKLNLDQNFHIFETNCQFWDKILRWLRMIP